MLKSGKFTDKKILLIDKDQVKTNDRTWCFWEQEPGFFEQLVYREWSHLDFFGEGFTATLDVSPYQYKMIRGVDFYAYCFSEIARHPQVEKLFGEVKGLARRNGKVILHIDDREMDLGDPVVFNSLLKEKRSKKDIVLLQHFKGWVIETETPFFDPGKATLMDFRIDQRHGTSFVYVLPFTEHAALVEYTLFTPALLKDEQYDEGLKSYINEYLGISTFLVKEQEFGIIPMSNRIHHFYKDGIYNIGTAGGQTKASTGYTFRFIQKQSDQIVQALINERPLSSIPKPPSRFRFYDNTLLHILYHDQLPGKQIFSTLFRRNDPRRVLRFLDNESTLADELKITSSLPTWPFLKAAAKTIFP
ncbi:lycopene cyclase family protein [Terrimonas sp. NA20]|uniref:Lycopene cyclase family protein n=2 Tax=Terrimonas ginsenosidimutans TaxID=2908004 RepID=A0ABS9KNU7_9BACT|nr:lycopene cyclase family protein [Terrimonas ginsenosidimutans]